MCIPLTRSFVFLFLVFLVSGCKPPATDVSTFDPIPYVDPFIGTGFHGHTFPGPSLPFGMVQLGPDTRLPGWDASSGYHYSDSTIYGFSHTHLSGTGIGDMGDILMLPFTGSDTDSLLAFFDKKEEKAEPGYYQVTLKNYGVNAELTTTLRSGMHRYTYPEGADQMLAVDLGHILQANWGHKSLTGKIELINNNIIRGMRVSSGWAYDHPVYFYAVFSAPYQVSEAFDGKKKISTDQLSGKELKAIFTFPENESQELLVKVGISSVSMEGARLNMFTENPEWDFDLVRNNAKETWRKELKKISIESKDEKVLKNFYTALYHTMMAPMTAQDSDGQYRGMDKNNHRATDGSTNYTVFSLWDTFRALHPLMSIINQKKSGEWAGALVRKYEEGGLLPKWPLASNYTGTMVGYPAVAVIADAMAKDIGGFDKQKALEAAVFSSEYHPEVLEKIAEPRAEEVMPKHLDYLNRLGFIPADSIVKSVSYGLECAYYDWCIAQMANKLDNKEVEAKYLKRSLYYQQYFDKEVGFMRGKLANGEWESPFNPNYSDHETSPFVEGNAWQWSWFVPHDVDGFATLMGGKEVFANKLDELFTTSSEIEGERASSDITGLIGQYAHGNEPSHHVTHFYNYLGQSYKTQERVDQVLQTLYEPTPAGISGNEDCGAMSAWYVMNALGFYQVCPGNPVYSIGRPIVDGATIHLENGATFLIKVENNSPKNKYVDQVSLNGEPLNTMFFSHKDLMTGGVLAFRMKGER